MQSSQCCFSDCRSTIVVAQMSFLIGTTSGLNLHQKSAQLHWGSMFHPTQTMTSPNGTGPYHQTTAGWLHPPTVVSQLLSLNKSKSSLNFCWYVLCSHHITPHWNKLMRISCADGTLLTVVQSSSCNWTNRLTANGPLLLHNSINFEYQGHLHQQYLDYSNT